MIDTNRLKLTLDFNAIDREFAIFKVQREHGNYKKSLIPDVAVQECKALSVQHTWGKECYILYRRTEADKYELAQKLEEYDDDIVITAVDAGEIKQYILAQLLFNAIPSLASEHRMYHNLMGSLHYIQPEWIKKREFHTLQIRLTSDFCLTLRVVTFKKVKGPGKGGEPHYLFDAESGALRRLLKDDPDRKQDQFVRGTWDSSTRNNVDFLNFGSLKEFDSSRVGILYHFLDEVKEYLGPYLTVECRKMEEGSRIQEKTVSPHIESLYDQLRACRVFLEDTVGNLSSGKLAADLTQRLRVQYEMEVQEGEPGEGDLLIRIVHERDYYAERPEEDPYGKAPEGCIVHHLTLEHWWTERKKLPDEKKEDPYLHKILLELGIKRDIRSRQLLFYNWAELGYKGPVTFVTANLLDGKSQHICYDRLVITPDGELNFDSWDNLETAKDGVWQAIEEAFKNRWNRFDLAVKGLMFEDPMFIQTIWDTECFTLPDVEELHQRLSDIKPDQKLEVEPLRAIIRSLMEKEEYEREKCTALLEKLEPMGKYEERKVLKKLLPMKGKLNIAICEAYQRETGQYINRRMKDADSKENMLGGMLDIRYLEEEGRTFYYSGYLANGIKFGMSKACRIREVTASAGSPQVAQILPLMAVDFVRVAAWTVVPFPFKYLREWRAEQDLKARLSK